MSNPFIVEPQLPDLGSNPVGMADTAAMQVAQPPPQITQQGGVSLPQSREEFDALPEYQKDALRMFKAAVLSGGRPTQADMTKFASESYVRYQDRQQKEVDSNQSRALEERKLTLEAEKQRAALTEEAVKVDQLESDANYAKELLGKLKTHKGLDYATGLSSKLPKLPGSDAANFQSVYDQVKGKAFLQAFQSLKGSGQITEIEGQKATEAIARLDPAQSKEAFVQALDEFAQVIDKGAQRAAMQKAALMKSPLLSGMQQASATSSRPPSQAQQQQQPQIIMKAGKKWRQLPNGKYVLAE